MSPEEFQRLKEAEKEHLRKLRELKNAVRAAERQRSLTQAAQQIAGAGQDVMGTREEMLDRLTRETARYEAHLEMALETVAEQEEAARRAAEAEQLEEEARRRRAGDLVRQLKEEVGGAARSEGAPVKPGEAEKGGTSAADPTQAPGKRPEKTIGRM